MNSILRGLIVSTFVLGVMTGAAIAKGTADSRAAARLSELTAAVSQRIESRQKSRFDSNFRRLAAERKELLSKLVESNPAVALRLTLGEGSLARIPSEFADLFEKRNEFKGELLVEAECEENNFRMRRYLKTGDSSKQLFLDADPATEMKTGDQVTTAGYEIDNKILASAEQATVTTSALAAATTGEKRVLVILVNFQDKPTQPFTVEQARDVTFNQTSNYMRENSYGQTWLTGDAVGWSTIPMSSTSCDIGMIASLAQQAATNAGAVLSAYDHQVYAFPTNACGWTGSGSIGGGPGQVWINNNFNVNSLGHELGHNFGLFHSRSLDCGSEVIGGSCITNEYGDIFDIMGGGSAAHINLFQKERLGWVSNGASRPIQTVIATGTFWIESYASASYGTKGLKILKSIDPTTGKKTWYYLERRTPYGFDSYMSEIPNLMSGVLIHSGSEVSGRDGYLLDMTPTTTSWYDPALVVGQSFTDGAAGLTITVLSADNTGATVQVEMNSQPCVRSNPSVSVTPGQSNWLTPGTTFSYTLSVANNNSVGCSPENFALSAKLPSGWSVSYSSTPVSIPPGESTSVTAQIASPAGAADGVYGIAFAASNGSQSGSASGYYSIVTQLKVSAYSGSTKYTRTQKATVKSNVSAGGSSLANVPVFFTMTKPNGTTVVQAAYSGSNGDASFVYQFDRKRDPTGTYTVQASAEWNGLKGQGNTSFLVNK